MAAIEKCSFGQPGYTDFSRPMDVGNAQSMHNIVLSAPVLPLYVSFSCPILERRKRRKTNQLPILYANSNQPSRICIVFPHGQMNKKWLLKLQKITPSRHNAGFPFDRLA